MYFVTGILMPTYRIENSRLYRFKLVTSNSEYLLELNEDLTEFAGRHEWELATARGALDKDFNVLRVEHLYLKNTPSSTNKLPRFDSSADLFSFNKAIAANGYLEVEPDYFVS